MRDETTRKKIATKYNEAIDSYKRINYNCRYRTKQFEGSEKDGNTADKDEDDRGNCKLLQADRSGYGNHEELSPFPRQGERDPCSDDWDKVSSVTRSS